jgi:hypothetical protein
MTSAPRHRKPDRRQADAACRGMDQDSLAGAELGNVDE